MWKLIICFNDMSVDLRLFQKRNGGEIVIREDNRWVNKVNVDYILYGNAIINTIV